MILSNRLTRSQKTDTLYPDLPLVYVLCCRKVWSLWNSVCECVRHPSNHVWWVFYLDTPLHDDSLVDGSFCCFRFSFFPFSSSFLIFSSLPALVFILKSLSFFLFSMPHALMFSICFLSGSSVLSLISFFPFSPFLYPRCTCTLTKNWLFYSSSLSFCLFSPTSFLSFTSVLWSLVLLYSCCFPSLRNVRTWLAPLKRWRWSSLLCYKNCICDKLFNFLNWIVLTMPSLRSYY